MTNDACTIYYNLIRNYNHVASLFQLNHWIDAEDEAEIVRTHYGGFSTLTKEGLRIVSLNSDWWYTANLYNYINVSISFNLPLGGFLGTGQ